MKKHTKIYMTFFDYGMDDFIPCELCGRRATDIHHIDARGMGGSKEKDKIENLMALCRSHHDMAEAELISPGNLSLRHMDLVRIYMEARNKTMALETIKVHINQNKQI